jgi:hypothetical protein
MARPASAAQAETPPKTTTNPIVAVGRKVKSVLSTDQRPSVRIQRDSSSKTSLHRGPLSTDTRERLAAHTAAEKQADVESAPQPPKARFAGIWSWFGAGGRHVTSGQSHEYDPDEVDLLDVVGTHEPA